MSSAAVSARLLDHFEDLFVPTYEVWVMETLCVWQLNRDLKLTAWQVLAIPHISDWASNPETSI